MMKKFILVLTCILAITMQARADSFTARVSRSELPYGETLLLILDYDGNNNKLEPNLKPLSDDFEIFSTSRSHSTQIINGNASSSHQWQIALMPKKSGALQIPALSLGSLKSQPIALNVYEGNISGQEGTPTYARFELKGEVDPKEAYVQQQIDYTLVLHDAGGLQSNAPEFLGNENGDWIIKQLKQPTVENKTINGVNVREIKFYYALFPQKSGKLETPMVRLEGYHLTPKNSSSTPQGIFGSGFFDMRVDLFDMMSLRSPISLAVKPISLDIKPIDANYGKNWWLPAKAVEISGEWENETPKFKVGEAAQRTITIAAVGVLEGQLPELKVNQSPEVKQYPQKPVRASLVDENGNLVAVEQIINDYIPQKEGKITLPEVKIAWFDVKDGQTKYAVLPEESIIVEPNPEIMMQKTYTEPEITAENSQSPALQTPDLPKQNQDSNRDYHASMLAVLLAFFAGLILSYFLFGKKSQTKQDVVLSATPKDIEKSAEKAEFKELRDKIIIWAKQYFKDDKISDLQAVCAKIKDEEFDKMAEIISKNLYSKQKEDWSSAEFMKVFNRIRRKKTKNKKSENPLPELYAGKKK